MLYPYAKARRLSHPKPSALYEHLPTAELAKSRDSERSPDFLFSLIFNFKTFPCVNSAALVLFQSITMCHRCIAALFDICEQNSSVRNIKGNREKYALYSFNSAYIYLLNFLFFNFFIASSLPSVAAAL